MASSSQQDFAHHTRWDPLYHFFVIPALFVTTVGFLIVFFKHPNIHTGWMVVLYVALVIWGFKTRMYALKVQDRVIRLEERLRLACVLSDRLRGRIGELSESQLIALRFASDDELEGLAEETMDKKLSAKEIKERIKQWRPDEWRI